MAAEAHITIAAADAVLQRLVQAQVDTLTEQQRTIEAINADTRGLIAQLRSGADVSLKRSQAAAEAQIESRVGAPRARTEASVTDVEGKLQEIRDRIFNHDAAQTAARTRARFSMSSFASFPRESKGPFSRPRMRSIGRRP